MATEFFDSIIHDTDMSFWSDPGMQNMGEL